MSTYPTTSTRALLTVLQERATSPFAISLGIGFTASTFYTISNVCSYLWSPAALVADEEGRKVTGLEGDVGKALRVWRWYFDRVQPQILASVGVATLGLSTAGFLIPVSSFSTYPRDLRRIIFASVLFTLAPLPYSLIAHKSTDSTLQSLSTKSHTTSTPLYPPSTSSTSNKPTTSLYSPDSRGLLPQEEAQAKILLEKWNAAHLGRVGLSLVGWVLGLGAVFLAY